MENCGILLINDKVLIWVALNTVMILWWSSFGGTISGLNRGGFIPKWSYCVDPFVEQ